MSPVLILPMLPISRATSATVGPVPGAATLGKELRQTLPPALVDALDRVGDQIEAEILDPLLSTTSVAELARTFERVFPKFRDYYVSTVLILWGFLQEDAQRLSVLTIGSFQESERLIRERGSRWIGQEASLNALHGLATITRIAKTATRLFDQGGSSRFRADESQAESWVNSFIAYMLAFSSVLTSLNALANGRTAKGKLENISMLARWSKDYAVQAYHLTKVIGLLKVAPAAGPIGASAEEDLVLAEAGLDSYAEMLRQDDEA